MRFIDAAEVAHVLSFPDLVDDLDVAFRSSIITPVRHHHAIAKAGEPDATLLLMPAWDNMAVSVGDGAVIGVKIVTVTPGNAARIGSIPSVVGAYLLLSGETGVPLAVIDGTALTLRRTAAASALAARHLARPDARRLVMVGAGALAPHLVAAHASVRPIRQVIVWNHHEERAEALASRLVAKGFNAMATTNLAGAVESADIVSVATLSHKPLVHGRWLQPGTHLDLVGAFTPEMRESDDLAVSRARVFVDTRAGALKEAGDIVQPVRAGVISQSDILGDLFDLCRGLHPGRQATDDITLFKSVGTALEDLAAAKAVWSRLG